MPLCRRGGRLTFLLLRQKQSKQKKRRPWCLRPSASLRAPSGARFKRGRARTRLAPQTIARPDPLEAPLLSAFTRAWGTGSGSDSGQLDFGSATIFIAAYARITWAVVRKYLKQRSRSLVFWVRSQFRCEAPAGRAEGVANLGSDPKTPDPASASPHTAPAHNSAHKTDTPSSAARTECCRSA